MDKRQAFREFLKNESWLAKVFLFFAVVSAILVPLSWFPHGFYVYLIIYPMGLAWMLFGLALFLVLGKRNISAMLGKQSSLAALPLPAIYWYCFGISLVYGLSVFFGYVVISSEGVYLGPTADFRIASSWFLFLNLGAFGFAHAAGPSQRTRVAG